MTALDAFGMIVADMAETLAFYRLLGLDIPDGLDSEQHVDLDVGGGVRFMLDTEELIHTFEESWVPPTQRGRVGLAVRCADPTEVNGIFARVMAAGHSAHLEPFDAFWGQRYASVIDPNGVIVDLYSELDAA
ncbi:MAG: VOC family protein [Acidimicrobiia bacterium]|nr:VOC family protein [Acidimicrobiia bacterium]MBT8213680.1 VOC family protein [Acidimicrobiia bacterium]NNF68544.1 glyoxalase [Acidimicrobiia bacterium]